jgi:hypothetical protein
MSWFRFFTELGFDLLLLMMPEVMRSKNHRLDGVLLVAQGMSVIRAESFGRCQSDLCRVVSRIRTLHTDYGMLWDIMKVGLFSFG